MNGGTEGLSPWVTIPLYRINCLLQFFQETGSLATVHLGMVELEGDGQRGLEPAFAVSAPRHKGIVKDAAILIDNAIDFLFHYLDVANWLTDISSIPIGKNLV